MPSEAAAIVRALGADARGARIDSRAIERGDLFLAAPGESADGRDFIAAAVANGAAGVLWEQAVFTGRETAKRRTRRCRACARARAKSPTLCMGNRRAKSQPRP